VGALVRSDRESDRREPGVVLRSLMQPGQPGAPSNRHRRRCARRLRRLCAAVIATVMASRDVAA
jgi:hypothetical protein